MLRELLDTPPDGLFDGDTRDQHLQCLASAYRVRICTILHTAFVECMFHSAFTLECTARKTLRTLPLFRLLLFAIFLSVNLVPGT